LAGAVSREAEVNAKANGKVFGIDEAARHLAEMVRFERKP
jgi:hypothetical protein